MGAFLGDFPTPLVKDLDRTGDSAAAAVSLRRGEAGTATVGSLRRGEAIADDSLRRVTGGSGRRGDAGIAVLIGVGGVAATDLGYGAMATGLKGGGGRPASAGLAGAA